MSYLKSVGTFFIYVGSLLTLITFIPGLPPHVEFHEYSITLPRFVDPKLGPKPGLRGAQRVFVDKFVGPESFDSYRDELYTGIHGGYIVKIKEDRVVPFIKFGKDCDGIWQEHICGRPLGFKFSSDGFLYVADAYYGIFKVDMTTKQYKNIVNINEPIEGKRPMIPNSIDVAENGDVYWTDSSTDFPLYEGMHTTFANPTGRLIRYNAVTRKNEVLLRDLAFANGIKLSHDESYVIVAETMKSSIIKYHLKGPKAGQHEIFIDGLPGLPDNIHSDGASGFLVSLVFGLDPDHPLLTQSLVPHPYFRKMISRLFYLIEMPFELIHRYYPNTCSEKAINWIGSFSLSTLLDSMKKSMVIWVDKSGNIHEVISSNDTDVNGISSAFVHDGYLWLGSPWNNYLTRVPLKQASSDLNARVNMLQNSDKITLDKKQPPKASAPDVNANRVKRDTDSAKLGSHSTQKKTATTTTPKPTPAPTTTPKPTAAPTTAKPTAAPKSTAKPAPPKVDKPADSKVKSSEANRASKSSNAEAKENAKTATKSNTKSEMNDRTRENAAKASIQSGKNVKIEQDASAKAQKGNPRK